MRILDDSENVAEWIEDRGHADAAAHVLNRAVLPGAELEQPGVRGLDVLDPPVGDRTSRPGPVLGPRIEPQLVAT
jgi:hypothetical protein